MYQRQSVQKEKYTKEEPNTPGYISPLGQISWCTQGPVTLEYIVLWTNYTVANCPRDYLHRGPLTGPKHAA